MKKTFLIGVIVGCKSTFDGLSETKGLSGKTTIARRKLLKPFYDEIESYEDLKNEKIKELGTDDGSGKVVIKPKSKEYDTIVKFINDMSTEQVEIEVGTPINVEELQSATRCELTDTEISNLIEFGILIEEVVEGEKKKSSKEMLKEKLKSKESVEIKDDAVEVDKKGPTEPVTEDTSKDLTVSDSK